MCVLTLEKVNVMSFFLFIVVNALMVLSDFSEILFLPETLWENYNFNFFYARKPRRKQNAKLTNKATRVTSLNDVNCKERWWQTETKTDLKVFLFNFHPQDALKSSEFKGVLMIPKAFQKDLHRNISDITGSACQKCHHLWTCPNHSFNCSLWRTNLWPKTDHADILIRKMKQIKVNAKVLKKVFCTTFDLTTG